MSTSTNWPAAAEVASVDVRSTEIKQALREIAERNEGRLQPEAVVEAAASPDSPLHDQFNWDDSDAARRWRLAQAGALIRRVKLTIVRQTSEAQAVVLTVSREYQSRPSQRSAEGGYENVQTIMSDDDKRREMLGQALKELSAFRKRYSELSELAEVWEAIDPLIES